MPKHTTKIGDNMKEVQVMSSGTLAAVLNDYFGFINLSSEEKGKFLTDVFEYLNQQGIRLKAGRCLHILDSLPLYKTTPRTSRPLHVSTTECL
jgi:hypothetical protein